MHAYALCVSFYFIVLLTLHSDGHGVKNDDGSHSFPQKIIKVGKHQHELTAESDMKFANKTVLVKQVEVHAFTQHEGKTSGGRLVSLLPISAGVFETIVNRQMVQDFNLEDANITLASQINYTLINEVKVHTLFNLCLPKKALGENSVILHALVVIVISEDENGKDHKHDQCFTVNYTKVEGQIPTPTVVTHTAGSSVNVSTGSGPTGQLEDGVTTGMGSSNQAVKVAVPIYLFAAAALIACMV